MSLALYGHPFSSYTQKVLVALYENDTAFEFRDIGPEHPEHAAEWLRRWPLARFPILVDGERDVVEASIIIEHLQLTRPGPVRLLPADPMAALEVRFLDRFFDLHVMNMVQLAVDGALTKDASKSKDALGRAVEKLETAYGWANRALAGRTWAASSGEFEEPKAERTRPMPGAASANDGFSLADCAAAPALFYADWVHPISGDYPNLRAYRARLLARPSFARAVEGGRPYRSLFPLGAPDRD